MTTAQLNDVSRLRERVARVVTPVDAGWDAARQAFNLTVDQHPTLIAYPSNASQVAAIVSFARERELRVAPQRTGHNAGPLGSLERTILLKTDELKGVAIDAAARRVRVAGGMKWEHVIPQASDMGLTALHGSTPDVSIAGYALGGGLGWYGRKHGLAANSVTAIEIVTADGELRRVDHDNEPDLFWALRGGGAGNFGVVTALELELIEVPELYAGVMFFPFERASEVLHTWHELTRHLPEEMTTVGRTMQFPPMEEIPEPMRGQSFALVEGFFLGSEADGRDLLAPIRELGPAIDTFAMVPPIGIAETHMDPPDPAPFVSDTQIVDNLTPGAIDDVVAVTGPGSGSPLTSVELRHTGGALGRAEAHHGALARLEGSYVMFAGGIAMDEAMTAGHEAYLARLTDALRGYEVGQYANFVESTYDARGFFPEDTYRRLQAVKAEYNPDNLFRANHEIAADEEVGRIAA
jgi:FAD/FMN-containing dehydrogenase